MKTIAAFIGVSVLLIGGVAGAATIKIVKTAEPWGEVSGMQTKTTVYRLVDTENKTVCYVGYHTNGFADMECVSVK